MAEQCRVKNRLSSMLFVYGSAMLLPIVAVLVLFFIWRAELAEGASLWTPVTLVVASAGLLSLCMAFYYIFRLLYFAAKVYQKIKLLLPAYHLNNFMSKYGQVRDPYAELEAIIDALGQYIQSINKRRVSLEEKSFSVSMESIYDNLLVNTFNRRHTEKLLRESLADADQQKPIAVAILDIDHFKMVNDTYGHDAGDMILKGVCDIIQNSLREGDVLGRWGGEEFCVFCRTDSREIAEKIYNRVRECVGQKSFSVNDSAGNVITLVKTMSIGFTLFSGEDGFELEEIMKRADEALYFSKENGRNQVTFKSLC